MFAQPTERYYCDPCIGVSEILQVFDEQEKKLTQSKQEFIASRIFSKYFWRAAQAQVHVLLSMPKSLSAKMAGQPFQGSKEQPKLCFLIRLICIFSYDLMWSENASVDKICKHTWIIFQKCLIRIFILTSSLCFNTDCIARTVLSCRSTIRIIR